MVVSQHIFSLPEIDTVFGPPGLEKSLFCFSVALSLDIWPGLPVPIVLYFFDEITSWMIFFAKITSTSFRDDK